MTKATKSSSSKESLACLHFDSSPCEERTFHAGIEQLVTAWAHLPPARSTPEVRRRRLPRRTADSADRGPVWVLRRATLGAVASTGCPVTPRELEAPSNANILGGFGPVSCPVLLEIRSRCGAYLNARRLREIYWYVACQARILHRKASSETKRPRDSLRIMCISAASDPTGDLAAFRESGPPG